MMYNSYVTTHSTPGRDRGGPYLTVTINHTEVQRRPLPEGPLTIGRSLDCELWIEDPLLSRHHCKLEPALEGDGYVVIDLNSRNGTFVNARRVKEREPLNDRDVITIGRAHVTFHKQGYCPPRPQGVEEALKMPVNRAAMHRQSGSTSSRALPTPKVANAETMGPGDTTAGGTPLPFTRPPARPIVKPLEDEDATS